MRDYNFYIETAKQNQGFKYDNQIDQALGFKASMMSMVKKGKTHLSDESMAKLADLAGVDKEIALLDLNIMRAPPTLQKTYAGILQKLTQTTAVIAIFAASTIAFAPSSAIAKVSNQKSASIYYGKYSVFF